MPGQRQKRIRTVGNRFETTKLQNRYPLFSIKGAAHYKVQDWSWHGVKAPGSWRIGVTQGSVPSPPY